MSYLNTIDRFLIAQANNNTYVTALAELREGRKRSHWMWYIFPQLRGLGHSQMAMFYGLSSLNEAQEYLKNEKLRTRIEECCNALLQHQEKNIEEILPFPDYLKLKSSMTLFEMASGREDSVYGKVLDAFFEGRRCSYTLENAQ